jgi:hypothetical protein
VAGSDQRLDVDHDQRAQPEEFLGQLVKAGRALVEVARRGDVRAGVRAQRLDLLERVARSLAALGHVGMGIDAVPQLPPERGVAREDGRVVAQRLPEEHLLRRDGIARVDRAVAGGNAARYHAQSSGSRARS